MIWHGKHRMEQYSLSIKHHIVPIYTAFAITVTSLSSIRAAVSSYPAKQRVFRAGMNYAELSSISRICKRAPKHIGSFSWMSTQFHGARGAASSDPCFPDISHNVEKRLRIRTLFHVRAFKLIMDGRIPLASLFSTPGRFRRQEGEGGKAGKENTQVRGSRIYTTRVDG